MPWQEVSVMEQRREFVRLAMQEGVNRRELFRRFGISRDYWMPPPSRGMTTEGRVIQEKIITR